MKERLRNFISQLSYLPQTLSLIWAAAKGLTLAWALLLFLQGLAPAATVYLTRLLVDGLAEGIGSGVNWTTLKPVMVLALVMGGIMLITQILQSVMFWVRAAQAERTRDHLSALVHEKSVSVDLAFYELAEYHDRLHRAQSDLKHRPLELLENAGSLIQSCITLTAMGALLIPYGIWLPFLLLISTLPALYVVILYNNRFHNFWEKTTTDRRWVDYYDTVLTHNDFAPEVRLFDLGSHIQTAYQDIRSALRNDRLDLIKKQGLARVGATIVATFISGGAMIWMLWRAFLGQVSLGDLALFYQAFNKGQGLLRSLLTSVGDFYNNTLFLGNLFEFLELEPKVTDPPDPTPIPIPLTQGIRFREVTFRYPGSKKAALSHFNFSVPAGKIVAIVGENGAGKSTLVKLLCRFYDPQEGSVELDNFDIRSFSVTRLRRMITAMFQFPLIHIATVAENIAIGNLGAHPDSADIEAAARKSGAHRFISELPKGYDTLLGKYFPEGTELSGGERQRLTLARAYLRQAQIMILDEPTSLMDSWSEFDWFDRLRKLAEGRTTIIITHRLTIAKSADVIHVMHAGQVIESGTHAELLALKGRYAASWQAQIQMNTGSSERNEAELPPDHATA